MNLLEKSDDEIIAIANPIWDNLVKTSNMKDYGGFTKDFGTQMLFGANEVELGKQWANNKLLTKFKRRLSSIWLFKTRSKYHCLFKQRSKEIEGEFLGRLVLGDEGDDVKVFGATIY